VWWKALRVGEGRVPTDTGALYRLITPEDETTSGGLGGMKAKEWRMSRMIPIGKVGAHRAKPSQHTTKGPLLVR
jgi:hypothetical protein